MSRKPKVLFVGSFRRSKSDRFVGGQMYACTALLESELSREIDFIPLDSTARTNLKRSFIERATGALGRLLRFGWILLVDRPDTVLVFCGAGYSFREKSWMIRLAKARGLRTVLAPRSGLIRNDVRDNPGFRNLIRKTLERTDVLLCQSESWRKFYADISPRPHSVVQPNWIEVRDYVMPTSRPNPPPFVFFFLGWITRNKGVFELLRAATILRELPLRIVLAGDGDARSEIADLIKDGGLGATVALLGWVAGDEKKKRLAEAHCFVLPSHREGYPNALLEAMAAGLPVITTPVGGIPDLVIDGKSGLLVDPGNPEALAAAMKKMLAQPDRAAEMGRSGRQRVVENNGLTKAVETFRKILNPSDRYAN